MQIFIYHDPNQMSLYQAISHGKYPMTDVFSVVDLEQKYNSMALPILVLISQPSNHLLEAILMRKWHVIISFIGVRNLKSDTITVKYFESDVVFHKLLETSIGSQVEALKKMYLNQFSNVSEEDALYLSTISGAALDAKTSNNKTSKKSIHKNKIYKSRIRTSIKKYDKSGLITVVGGAEVAAQLAKSIARKSSRSVLIIDGDLLKPSLDVAFGIKNIQTPIKSHLIGLDNSGLNIALDALSKGFDICESIDSVTKKINRNLSVMLGNYNFYNYEHYDAQMLNKLISKLQTHYQFVILNVSDSPYDSLTMLGLHRSAVNLMVSSNDMTEIRYKVNLTKILSAKQGIPYEKNAIVTADKKVFIRKTATSVIRYLFGKNYIGHFGSSKRQDEKIADLLVERMGAWD